ncbi:MAG: hypothetical protein QOF51_2212 [Chloroflexota bacterium]|nr:hypothetical protein [Chloroflexota bacterium]
MKERPHVGVIGAGILGLTAAYRFAQAGARVTVIEREDHVGGLAASFTIAGKPLERFYHHLFRSDHAARDLIDEVGLGDALIWPRPTTSSLVGGSFYQLDSPSAVLRFSPLPMTDRLRLGAGAAYLKLLPRADPLEGQTSVAWIKRTMGPEAYRVVWGPLLRAKFGAYAESIALPWFWARVHYRSPRLGYVRHGFGRLYERLAERIEARGGTIHLSTEVKRIHAEAGQVIVDTSHGPEQFDHLLVTIPTRLFTRLADDVPDEYRAQYEWGDYYGAHVVVLALRQQLLPGIYWLSVHDPEFPFLAVVEHTNYMPPSDYGGRHIVYLGNYLPMSDPLFHQADEEVLDRFLAALPQINPAFDRSWVEESHVFKAPFAQPIVTVDYKDHIPPHTTPLPGVTLANMGQVYPQDRGQNYSIKLANEVAATILDELGVGGSSRVSEPAR